MKTSAVLGVFIGSFVAPFLAARAVMAAPAAETETRAVKRAFLPEFRAQIKADPTVAPRLLREFWDDNKDQKTGPLIETSIKAARILWHSDRTTPEAPLELLDLTIQRFPNDRLRFRAVEAKAEILRRANRLDEATQLLETAWPQVKSTNLDPVMLPILSERVEVLRLQKKPDQAIELLYESLQNTPPLVNWMNFYRLMVDAQTDAGHDEEALRWAALFFRIAPFEDDDIARATSLVSRLWLQNADTKDNPALFAAAQTDVGAPNPLQEVALPILPALASEAVRARLQSDADKEVSPSRVAITLMANEPRAAMMGAREILLRDPTGKAGAAEVARVFKFVDGDVARANAFLQFQRTGAGENPMVEFLREVTP